MGGQIMSNINISLYGYSHSHAMCICGIVLKMIFPSVVRMLLCLSLVLIWCAEKSYQVCRAAESHQMNFFDDAQHQRHEGMSNVNYTILNVIVVVAGGNAKQTIY